MAEVSSPSLNFELSRVARALFAVLYKKGKISKAQYF